MTTADRPDASPVSIFTSWAAEPVFHLHRRWDDEELGHEVSRLEREDGLVDVRHRSRAWCGRTLSAWGWTEDPRVEDWRSRFSAEWHRDPALVLRRDHAEKIGRPCERCLGAAGEPESRP